MLERRAHVRVATKVDIVYSRCNSQDAEKLSFTRDISKGGACLILSEELKAADLLDLKIKLPTEKTPVSLKAKVVWINKFVFGDPPKERGFFAGVQFMNVDEDTGKKIDGFISTAI